MAAGANLEATNSLVTGAVLLVMVIVSMLVEHFLHWLDHFLSHKDYTGLVVALSKAKDELMLLGFVTFTLLIVEEHLIGHCIDKPSFWDWWIMKEDCSDYKPYGYDKAPYGDSKYPSSSGYGDSKYPASSGKYYPPPSSGKYYPPPSSGGYKGRRLFGAGGDVNECPEGKVELISLNALHQIHLLIFLAAMIHIFYSALVVFRALNVAKSFDAWERRYHIAKKIHTKASAHLEDLRKTKSQIVETEAQNGEKGAIATQKSAKLKAMINRTVTTKIRMFGAKELKNARQDYEVRAAQHQARQSCGALYFIFKPVVVTYVTVKFKIAQLIKDRDERVRRVAEREAPDFNKWSTSFYWLPYLLERQLLHPFSYLEYVTIRKEALHNVMDHMSAEARAEVQKAGFDFGAYARLSLEDIFTKLVGADELFWFTLILTVVLNGNKDTYVFSWLPSLSVLISLALGCKVTAGVLQVTYGSRLFHTNSGKSIQSMKDFLNHSVAQSNQYEMHAGKGQMKRQMRKSLFWFDSPDFMLKLVKFQMFAASMTIATPLFFMWQLEHEEPNYNCARQDGADEVYTYMRIIISILQIVHTATVILPQHTVLMQTSRHYNNDMLECMDPQEIERFRKMALDRSERHAGHAEDGGHDDAPKGMLQRTLSRTLSGKALKQEGDVESNSKLQSEQINSKAAHKKHDFKHDINEFVKKATAYRYLTAQAESLAEESARRIQTRWLKNRKRARGRVGKAFGAINHAISDTLTSTKNLLMGGRTAEESGSSPPKVQAIVSTTEPSARGESSAAAEETITVPTTSGSGEGAPTAPSDEAETAAPSPAPLNLNTPMETGNGETGNGETGNGGTVREQI